ncbi:hypothetical protein BN137_429 [Cronobacter condimenti 1330]|uniref:Uncharacterized protein n=1 Tax=Cronobacter condimenti 1330 TaxID=1073999 RepID=K8A6A5_9ENTR|nr:hypothetical protein BN137_429 [Cronobacter condimenti 1330]
MYAKETPLTTPPLACLNGVLNAQFLTASLAASITYSNLYPVI